MRISDLIADLIEIKENEGDIRIMGFTHMSTIGISIEVSKQYLVCDSKNNNMIFITADPWCDNDQYTEDICCLNIKDG